MTHNEFIISVIKCRKRLLAMRESRKNDMICIKIIARLEKLISAYGSKWSQDQWKRFIARNYDDIIYLIPGNKAGQTRIETLNDLLL